MTLNSLRSANLQNLSGSVPVHPWIQSARQQFNLRKVLFHQCHFENIEYYFNNYPEYSQTTINDPSQYLNKELLPIAAAS